MLTVDLYSTLRIITLKHFVNLFAIYRLKCCTFSGLIGYYISEQDKTRVLLTTTYYIKRMKYSRKRARKETVDFIFLVLYSKVLTH